MLSLLLLIFFKKNYVPWNVATKIKSFNLVTGY